MMATEHDCGQRARPRRPRGWSGGATVMAVVFGILLPVGVLALELASGLSAEHYVDPVPSLPHALLVAWVPLANLFALVGLVSRSTRYAWFLDWANGLAIGISIYYAVVFLPLTPFAVIGIVVYGLGLLPLSPLLALVTAGGLRVALRRHLNTSGAAGFGGVWRGIAAGLGLVILLAAPMTVTIIGAQMATQGTVERQRSGVRLLRRFGSRSALLRMCYVRSGRAGDPLGFIVSEMGPRVSTGRARELYYRVTGVPFNAVEPPRVRGVLGRTGIVSDWDFDVGGDAVQARVRGLSLAESRLDARIEGDGCHAYTEWTMVFVNHSGRQQEARAQIALPSGGVVSRLTLWIDGEEREAAFGSRGRVKEAYRKVVQRRRDPVLVTTSGPDRVLMQCFPVPPGGGTMKLRVGITSPLVLRSLDRGVFRMPYLEERNFGLAPDAVHAVWIDGTHALTAPGLSLTADAARPGSALRGTLPLEALERPLAVASARPVDSLACWAPDTRRAEGAIVSQVVIAEHVAAPARVIVVLDGSRRMRPFANTVAEALCRLPAGVEFAVILASDDTVELVPPQQGSPEAFRRAARAVRTAYFGGGCNNALALGKAWDLACGVPGSAIVWLHATQPVELGGSALLRQRSERGAGPPSLYELQFGTGPNVLARELDGLPSVHSAAVSSDPGEDLLHLADLWSGRAQRLALERSRVAGQAAGAGLQTSGHLVRLWAHDRIGVLAASRAQSDRDEAGALAATYQLVTSVSGAVVLETARQYEEAGLKPVDPATVPTMSVPSVPEPETWALLIVVAVLFLALRVRSRMAARAVVMARHRS